MTTTTEARIGVSRYSTVSRDAAVRRMSFSFSARATHAACLATGGHLGLVVETWSCAGAWATSRLLPAAAAETVHTQPIACEDGRVIRIRNGSGRHEVAVLSALGVGTAEQVLVTMRCQTLRGLPSRDPATLGWLVAYHAEGRSVIYRIDALGLGVEPVLEAPGRFVGEGWLTEAGDRLGANHIADGRRRIAQLDLGAGTLHHLPETAGALLLTNPSREELLVATGSAGEIRLGWTSARESSVRFPAALNQLTGAVRPVAVDPTGRHLALRITDGARSRLVVHDGQSDVVTEPAIPPGVIRAVGWSDTGLRCLYSAPDQPATIATAGSPPGFRFTVATEPPMADRRWHHADLEHFDGPEGPIEAVVYGDWRRSRHLVIAVHDGPSAAWDLSFDPTFQRLADAGIAVVAPNQRGSIGYGTAHRDALAGAWGGPDLDDILHLRDTLHASRRDLACRPPMLLGFSYGAFLALVAAAARPLAWSRCVAVAPFISGSRLYHEASAEVRTMLEQLGGRTELTDQLGSRDLLRLGPSVRAPVLLIHGERDHVVPVAHSRLLAQRLATAGCSIRYREIADGGHNPLDEAAGPAMAEEVVGFLLGNTGPSVRR